MTIPVGAERLIHQRSKGPISTPATRLVELQNALSAVERDLNEERVANAKLAQRLDVFTKLGAVSFGGIRAAQTWTDTLLWEAVLNDNPQLKAIFEIGTWKGGFSWWLWAQCEARRKANKMPMHFETYDAVKPHVYVPGFRRADVFAEYATLGITFRAWEPCLVFCDGGNKPRELKIFAEQLEHPESLLVVHDWGTEIGPEDVPASVRMVYDDFCDEIGSISRVFQLKEQNA